ncbi:MAG: ABC transporter permease [Treponema sp.]|jgi:AI-2 transport system permease protein|nr:ABC transporter permease [Treponema sp.]
MRGLPGLKNLLKIRELSALSSVVILFLFVGLFNPGFLSRSNILLILNDSVVFTMLAVGTSFVIITGEIDVSIGAVTGLCAAVAGSLIRDGAAFLPALAFTLFLALVCGLVNGAGFMFLKIPSIIITLGTGGIIRGIIYVYTRGRWVEDMPTAFKDLSRVSFGGISVFYWIALIIVAAGTLIMTRTRQGRYFAAIGDNIACATFLGIPVRFTKMLAFALGSLFAGAGGIMFASRVGFVAPIAGTGYEMRAIAACVLGGVSLSGGVGSLAGASMGAVIIASIRPILVFLNFTADDDMITGTILITIIVVDALLQRRTVEKARRQRLLAKTRNPSSGVEHEETA